MNEDELTGLGGHDALDDALEDALRAGEEGLSPVSLVVMDVDKLGLDQNDRNILLMIIEKFSGGPVGLDTLAAALGEDAGTLEDVYEPYLLMNGLINRTPRGRMATESAYRHLGLEMG